MQDNSDLHTHDGISKLLSTEAETPSINTMSSEVLQQFVKHLDPPSAICFALTNHKHYGIVLAGNGITWLGSLCSRGLPHVSQLADIDGPGDRERMMRQLKTWMPDDYAYSRYSSMWHIVPCTDSCKVSRARAIIFHR